MQRVSDEIIEITIQKSIKWIRRYGAIDIDPDVHQQILWLALKGLHCERDHLCPFQRDSILELLKNTESIKNPYIIQFIKDHGKKPESDEVIV